jgi:hypothetical protein
MENLVGLGQRELIHLHRLLKALAAEQTVEQTASTALAPIGLHAFDFPL